MRHTPPPESGSIRHDGLAAVRWTIEHMDSGAVEFNLSTAQLAAACHVAPLVTARRPDESPAVLETTTRALSRIAAALRIRETAAREDQEAAQLAAQLSARQGNRPGQDPSRVPTDTPPPTMPPPAAGNALPTTIADLRARVDAQRPERPQQPPSVPDAWAAQLAAARRDIADRAETLIDF